MNTFDKQCWKAGFKGLGRSLLIVLRYIAKEMSKEKIKRKPDPNYAGWIETAYMHDDIGAFEKEALLSEYDHD